MKSIRLRSYQLSCICLLIVSGLSLHLQAQNKEKLYTKGIRYFEKGRFEKGHTQMQALLRIDKTHRDALYAEAFYYLVAGKYNQALASFNTLLGHHAQDYAAYIGRAKTWMQLDSLAAAEEDLIDAYQLDSTQAEIYTAFGQLYTLASLHNDANVFLDRALAIDPQNAEAYQWLAFNYWLQEDEEAALAYINKSLEQDPDQVQAQKIKAYLKLVKGDYKEVDRIYQNILDRTPDVLTEQDFYTWGTAYYFLKAYSKALYLLRTPEATENPAIAYSLARTYFAIKEYPTAFHKIDTAIAITRELALPTATLYYDRAVMYAKTGRYKKAKKDFFEAITQAPELIAQTDEKGKTIPLLGDATYLLRKYISPQEKDSIQTVGWQERAYNLGLADELSAAQVAIQKAYSLDSLNARTVTIQALIAALDEDYERALVLFEEAEGLPNAQDKELIYYLRAMTWVEMEQYSKALASLDKALVENPKEATYYYEKASIQHTLGQLEEALTLINQALLLTADPTYQLEKAFYLYELDRYAAALNICNALLEKDVMYTEVYYYRALIYQAQEEYEKALQDVAHALRYYPDDEELQALQEELASK